MYTTTLALSALLTLAQGSPLTQTKRNGDTCVISAYWHHDHTITPDLGSGSGPIDRHDDTYLLKIYKNGNEVYNDGGNNKLLGSTSHTLSGSDNGPGQDLTWSGSNFDGWQWCECTYGGGEKVHSEDITKGGDTFLTTTSSDETCTCQFGC